MTKNRLLSVILPLLAMIVSVALGDEGTAEKLTLCTDGATDYTIVLPDSPTEVQKTAANELASFLNRVTGADFPILSEGMIEEQARDKAKLLVIGPGELSKKLLACVGAEPEETIGYDGIIIEPVGRSVVFSGHPKRGTLYAVYTFLEDTVGIRWWTSTESTIPKRPTLKAAITPTRYAPKVISREAFYRDSVFSENAGVFSARMKMNGQNNPIPPEYGGHETFYFFGHSFYIILPADKYFDEHPDWYPLINGKRTRGNVQLCLMNPEMRKEFIRNTLQILEEHPEVNNISICQDDCAGWCQCPECQKCVDENGSQSGPLIDFINEVAEAVEKEHPDVIVNTFAYQATRFAPSKVRPRDNVLIRLCTIENSFLTPLEEGGLNQSLVENIEKWSAISKQLFVWDYVTDFHCYMLPHPNLHVLGPNIRFFVKNNVVGIFEQGDVFCAAGDFVRLRNWVISKLLWNPDLDQRALENEFLNGYYSPNVRPLLRQYLDLLTKRAVEKNIHLGCFLDSAYGWLDTPTLVEATNLMNRAIAAARDDEKHSPERFAGLADKLQRESIPVHLAWLSEWPLRQADLLSNNIPSPVAEGEKYYEEYLALLEKNHVTSAVEGGEANFGNWLESLHEIVRSKSVIPEEVKDLPRDTWYNLEEFAMPLGAVGELSFREDDAAADNGRAVRLPGNHHEWEVGWAPSPIFQLRSPSAAAPDEEGFVSARMILRARCQAVEGDDSDALEIGIWDFGRTCNTFHRTLKSSELGKEEYKTIDLGIVKIGTTSHFWIAPTDHPEAVQNLYIDRVVFIRQ
ncbi:MAG: DUF4838 domain-containing protein [Thermoguttaceae bacterium]|nr:DUF4838 domain-containing protein [Thermoguttaceae bacterium]